jgi:hypothetical protein
MIWLKENQDNPTANAMPKLATSAAQATEAKTSQ